MQVKACRRMVLAVALIAVIGIQPWRVSAQNNGPQQSAPPQQPEPVKPPTSSTPSGQPQRQLPPPPQVAISVQV